MTDFELSALEVCYYYPLAYLPLVLLMIMILMVGMMLGECSRSGAVWHNAEQAPEMRVINNITEIVAIKKLASSSAAGLLYCAVHHTLSAQLQWPHLFLVLAIMGGILRFGRRRTGRHVVGNTAADTFRHAALEGRVIVTSFDGVSVQTKYDCVTLHVHIKFTSGMSFFFFF